MAETAKERSDRLAEAHSKSVSDYVNGIKPLPFTRYTYDQLGRKKYATFEDYLNG